MRPWPLVAASGASGGVVSLLLQIFRELNSDSGLLVPPDPVLPSALAGTLELGRDSWIGDLHLPSVILGICIGLLLGPCLDFCLLLRIGLLRSLGRDSRPIARLYRILE